MIAKIFKHKHELALLLGVLVYDTYFTIASFLRYDNFYTGRFDLGNMSQTVWNTAHGRIFLLTNPNGTMDISRLAFHADFILIFLAPFYFIWSNPKMLLLIQTLVLSFGAIFVYLISKEVTKNKLISLVFGLTYLLNPAVQYTNLYDFHAVTFATTFLLASFYFMYKRNYLPTVTFLILAGITKENVWAITSLLGLYILFINKQKVFGTLISGLSLIIFYVLVWHLIPNALGGQHFALSYYSDFGATPSGVIKNVFIHPAQTLRDMTSPNSLDYIRQLFLPLGYISVLGLPFLIFTIPSFLINLLSSNPQLHQIYYQYSSTITPFVFISAVFGVKLLLKKIPEITPVNISFIIILFTLITTLTYGPLPFSKKPNTDMFFKPQPNVSVINNYLDKIPESKSISATNNLGSHLSHRQNIYTIPLGINKADYVLFLLTPSDFNSQEMDNIEDRIEQNSNYKLALRIDNFFAFEKVK